MEALQCEEAEARQTIGHFRDSERSWDGVVAQRREEVRECQQAHAEIQRRDATLHLQQQALRDAQADLSRRALMDEVQVPKPRCGSRPLQDGSPGSRLQFIDFASLPEAKKRVSAHEVALVETEYRDELARLRAELERRTPNLKAIEQMKDAMRLAENASQTASLARRDIEDVQRRFEAVRAARRNRFMDCFERVAAEIGGVYRRLTAFSVGRDIDGGTAFLDLEDTEDPFNGGVRFTAMPPLKRFFDVNQLSGGERTLAAIALIFAVQAYQRPPFLVLDEVDASLDTHNVLALAGYVEKCECQAIVISLKDQLFSRSEGLVGVSKDKRRQTSIVLTVDLQRFRRETDVVEEAVPLTD